MLIKEVESARSDYFRMKGISQDATVFKDKTLSSLNEWMYDFYAFARFALMHNPQLLEALGVNVKS
jgi:hypothetical protein